MRSFMCVHLCTKHTRCHRLTYTSVSRCTTESGLWATADRSPDTTTTLVTIGITGVTAGHSTGGVRALTSAAAMAMPWEGTRRTVGAKTTMTIETHMPMGWGVRMGKVRPTGGHTTTTNTTILRSSPGLGTVGGRAGSSAAMHQQHTRQLRTTENMTIH